MKFDPFEWRVISPVRCMKHQFDCFLKYSHKQFSIGDLVVKDPSLVALTVDVSKAPFLNNQKAKTNNQEQVWTFAKAVYEALPKTWTIKVNYNDNSLFALKFIFSVGDGMKDWFSHSPLYRLERLDVAPLTLNWKDNVFVDGVSVPCVLDRALWDSICKTLNSDSFKKKAFPHLRGNA